MPSMDYYPQSISCYFKIPQWIDSFPPEYKRLRLFVGKRYGNTTLYLSLLLICLIPFYNFIKWKLIVKEKPLSQVISSTDRPLSHKFLVHSSTLKVILFWGLFSLILNLIDTYSDLMFITKRLGRVATASMPGLLFLTLRPSPLPNTLYLALLPVHKWLSRIVVLESILHTGLYLYYYYRSGTIFKIFKPANLYGFLALFAFVVIGVTSLSRVRRSMFKVFYFSHYVLTWVSVIALYYHARPGIPLYTILNIGVLLLQVLYRILLTSKTKITTIQVSPTLTLVEFPKSSLRKKPVLPAAHIRINNKNGILKDLFYQIVPLAHPYTIASLPNEEIVKLIIRGGKFPLLNNREYYVSGVFEPNYNFIKQESFLNRFKRVRQSPAERLFDTSFPISRNIDAERVLIVVGGSGISFGIPLLRELSYNGVSARLIWVCKDIKDLNLLNHFRGIQDIECYITSDANEDDIVIDYYEDGKTENDVFKINRYGSTDPSTSEHEDEDEIDFTASYKVPIKPYSAKNSSKENPDLTMASFAGISTELTTKYKHDKYDASNCEYIVSRSKKPDSNPVSKKPSSISEDIDFESFKNIKVPKSISIYYGRPNLNSSHYNWCLESQCLGPTVNIDGEVGCCRDSDQHHVDRSKIWVVAAGPRGLVEHAQQWALDGGLQCHTESFAV
ncbi:hypothetical protein WICMUC_005826 [Wickerhamomyces mucosus]|uniref:Ferric oxidoreductase domain-containing protein n=1 Tax=Wickerhamomyces mucosus TaxID=1378264 RepID=A0A9P8T383_9ASCO|nr:hypothetical protein WICMUC_005826 [Wickerhamomyces mucosus]